MARYAIALLIGLLAVAASAQPLVRAKPKPISSAASTPITQVQTKTFGASANSTTHTLTFTSTPTSGNLLVVCIVADDFMATAPSGWTKAGTGAQDFTGCYIIYKVAGASEPTSVTITIGSSTSCCMQGYEYSGIVSSSPLDQSAAATGQGTTTTINTGTTGTTSQAKELAVAVVAQSTAGSFTLRTVTGWSNTFVDLGSTDSSAVGTTCRINSSTKILAATGTQTTTATLSGNGSGHNNGVIATFLGN